MGDGVSVTIGSEAVLESVEMVGKTGAGLFVSGATLFGISAVSSVCSLISDSISAGIGAGGMSTGGMGVAVGSKGLFWAIADRTGVWVGGGGTLSVGTGKEVTVGVKEEMSSG
jgi:hypothetical protein